jgi:hypothetical protein
MQLRPPDLPDISFKALRGLFDSPAYASRPDLMALDLQAEPVLTPLEPGQETVVWNTISVDDLPPNANVKQCQLTIEYPESSNGAEQTTQVGIQSDSGGETLYNLRVISPNAPRNVAIRLKGGETIWTHAGAMTATSYTLSNFAGPLNAYLDRVKPEQNHLFLQFLVKSDTDGQIKLNTQVQEYSLLKTHIWENAQDQTARIDQTFGLDFGTVQRVPLARLSDPNPTSHTITLDIAGELDQERLLGQIDAPPNVNQFATISLDYALAQQIILPFSLRLIGISVWLQGSAEAELYVEIQPDRNDLPAVDTPLAQSTRSFTKGQANDSAQWQWIDLGSPVDLQAERPYWLVIKGIRGKAQLGLQESNADYLHRMLVHRGGQLWKPLSSSASHSPALLRLIYLPGSENPLSAIEMGLESLETSFRFLDPGAEIQTVSLDANSLGTRQPVLLFKSHARGQLTLANIIQDYKPRTLSAGTRR